MLLSDDADGAGGTAAHGERLRIDRRYWLHVELVIAGALDVVITFEDERVRPGHRQRHIFDVRIRPVENLPSCGPIQSPFDGRAQLSIKISPRPGGGAEAENLRGACRIERSRDGRAGGDRRGGRRIQQPKRVVADGAATAFDRELIVSRRQPQQRIGNADAVRTVKAPLADLGAGWSEERPHHVGAVTQHVEKQIAGITQVEQVLVHLARGVDGRGYRLSDDERIARQRQHRIVAHPRVAGMRNPGYPPHRHRHRVPANRCRLTGAWWRARRRSRMRRPLFHTG